MRQCEGTLRGSGNIPLWYWGQVVDEARGTCLLVHGLGEHSGRYRHVAEALTRERFSVWALDYRGHGRSGGRRGHCGSFDELLDDVGRGVAHLQSEVAQGLPILIGHSLGGLIVLSYALGHPRAVRAVVASSPALGLSMPLPRLKQWFADTLGHLCASLTVDNGVRPEWLSHDPQVVSDYQSDPQVHRQVSFGGYLAARGAMAWAAVHAAQMAVPCLIMQAGGDRIVSPEASQRFAAQVKSPGSEYRVYPGWYHELFNEVDRQRALADLCQWLVARCS